MRRRTAGAHPQQQGDTQDDPQTSRGPGGYDRRALHRPERAGAHDAAGVEVPRKPDLRLGQRAEPRRADRGQRQHQHRQRRQPRPRSSAPTPRPAPATPRRRSGSRRTSSARPRPRPRRRSSPELGRAIGQKPTATAKVENLQVQIPAGSPSLLGVKAATSSATGTCVSGSTTPKLDGTSQVADLTVLGAPIGLDGLLGALTQALAAARLPRRPQDQREDHRTATAR